MSETPWSGPSVNEKASDAHCGTYRSLQEPGWPPT